jgi:hypothetical protein
MSMTSMPASLMPAASAAGQFGPGQAAVAADGDRALTARDVTASLSRVRDRSAAHGCSGGQRPADDAADVIGLEDFR